MTFTYDNTSISTDLAKVRLRLGDTNSDDPLLTDEEINHFLGIAANFNDATVRACRAIVAKFARIVNVSAAGITSGKESKFRQYKDLLAELEADLSQANSPYQAATPFVGGISINRSNNADQDTDFRPHSFGVGMHDYRDNDDDDPTGCR